MVFKFFKNTIFKGKLYRKGVTYEIADAESLEKRGFGEVVEDEINDETAPPAEGETNTEETTPPAEGETNTEETTPPADDTSDKGEKPVLQSTAKKKGK